MSQADESDEKPENKDEDQPAGQRRLILISGAVVVVLAAVGLVVYLLVGDNDPDNASGTDVPTITGSAPPTTQTTSQAPATSTSQTQAQTTTPPPVAEGEPAEAKSVAEQAATAISSGDVTTIAALSCDPSSVPQEGDYPADAKAEVVGEPQITGDTATIDLRLTIAGTEPTIVPMPLTKQDGRWCVP